MFPAKRDPDGYIAQRILPDDHVSGPWLLTTWREDSGVYIAILTDDDVAAWADVPDS